MKESEPTEHTSDLWFDVGGVVAGMLVALVMLSSLIVPALLRGSVVGFFVVMIGCGCGHWAICDCGIYFAARRARTVIVRSSRDRRRPAFLAGLGVGGASCVACVAAYFLLLPPKISGISDLGALARAWYAPVVVAPVTGVVATRMCAHWFFKTLDKSSEP